MSGDNQQLALVHAHDEFSADRTDELDRTRQAQTGRLLGDETDLGKLEWLQEIEIHAGGREFSHQILSLIHI